MSADFVKAYHDVRDAVARNLNTDDDFPKIMGAIMAAYADLEKVGCSREVLVNMLRQSADAIADGRPVDRMH